MEESHVYVKANNRVRIHVESLNKIDILWVEKWIALEDSPAALLRAKQDLETITGLSLKGYQRLDELTLVLQQVPGFTCTEEYGNLARFGISWCEKLEPEVFWQAYPVFYEGTVWTRVMKIEDDMEIHVNGFSWKGKLGSWVVFDGRGTTKVGELALGFKIRDLVQHPDLIHFGETVDRNACMFS